MGPGSVRAPAYTQVRVEGELDLAKTQRISPRVRSVMGSPAGPGHSSTSHLSLSRFCVFLALTSSGVSKGSAHVKAVSGLVMRPWWVIPGSIVITPLKPRRAARRAPPAPPVLINRG